MSATAQDVSALEHLAHRLRADTHGCAPWDRHGTHIVFTRELIGLNLQIATELVLAHALDPDAKTPAAITRPFKPERVPPPTPEPARCPEHPDELAQPFCRIHKTEHVRAYNDLPDGAPIPKDLALKTARNALKETSS